MWDTKGKHHILIVDDAEINRSMLADMLSDQYNVLEAENGLQAVSILEKRETEISLVLLDIMMPVMNGFEVLAFVAKNERLAGLPVIMISAETSSSYIDRAYDLGATDYISRPFDEKTVRRRVQNTIMLYAKQKMLEEMVTEQILEKEHSNFLMVEILSNIVEFRNGESGLHVIHIRTITELLLQHLVRMTDQFPLTAAQISLIVNASALHDIGKISIPESILNKPGKLTAEEFEIMKTHTTIGAKMLENSEHRQNEALLQAAHEICRWHHERYDGRGYPDGLKGDEIPVSAQAVALADVYDALTSERVYKAAFSHETAIRMIQNGECGAFHPILLRCLAEMGPRIKKEMSRSVEEQLTVSDAADISRQIVSSGNASSRTLALLEQERTKYRFFASMSKELQFEYNFITDLLTLSGWGAEQLGLSEVIAHPDRSEELRKVLRREDLLDLRNKLRLATPEAPVVQDSYQLSFHGQPRWYKVVARALWVGEDNPVMTGTIGKFMDAHEEHTQLELLKKQAEQDPLTGLHNHRSARRLIENTLKKNRSQPSALILLDLDFFKDANDQYGHLFGDEVLKEVARRVLEHVRQKDVAARIGGDEFLIFLDSCNDVVLVADRIFQAVRGIYKEFPISLSMGVAVSHRDGEDYEALFRHADQALYEAKRRSRDQCCFYEPSIRANRSVLSPIESNLEKPQGDA